MLIRQKIRIIKQGERTNAPDGGEKEMTTRKGEQQSARERSREASAVVASWVREIQNRRPAEGKLAFHNLFAVAIPHAQ